MYHIPQIRRDAPEQWHPWGVQEVLRTRKALVPPSQAVTCFGIKYESPGIFYLGFILGARPPCIFPRQLLKFSPCCMSWGLRYRETHYPYFINVDIPPFNASQSTVASSTPQ